MAEGRAGERESLPVGTHVIVHEGGALGQDGRVIRELLLVHVQAVLDLVGAVVDVAVVVDVAQALEQLVGLGGHLGVRVVTGVAGEASAEVEVDAVGDGVDVVPAVVEAVGLPPQAAVAVAARHAPLHHGLLVEDGLHHRQVVDVVFLVGRREVGLGRQHGRHGPEALVVVAHGRRPVGRHEVPLFADLVHDGPRDHAVVCLVPRDMAIVEESSPPNTTPVSSRYTHA